MADGACPHILTGEAREEWDSVAGWLRERGLFDKRRADALLVHCRAWSRFVEAAETLAREGRLIRSARGTVRLHPAAKVEHQATDEILSVMDILGTSPAARIKNGWA